MISESMRVKVNLVGFLVLAAGLIYAMATQVLSVLENRYSVYAIFEDAGGVFTNQEVTYRGVTVGQVGLMEVIEDGVRIELLIRDEIDIPKDDIEARVMFKSAVGEQFVDLLPAGDGEPFLQDGDEIPLAQTTIPVSTQELLATLEAVLRGVPPEDLKGAVDALGIGLTGRGPDLATIIESSADLATLFAERAPEVQGILEKGTKVGGAFLASKEDFEEAIAQLVVVSETLAGSTGDLERLMRGTNETSEELVRLIRENDPQLNQVIVQLAEINELQAEHEGDLNQLFFHLPVALTSVNKAFEPETGLVRFGLVNDNGNPACSYGTERRPPSNRAPQLPPKNAHCGGSPSTVSTSRSSGQSSASSSDSATTSLLPGVDVPTTSGSDLRLPARLSDWSWSLFYLNVL
jgi:phospholipid/cholesterol/gamma-HCH transport system substrate-binding protein